MPIYEITTGEIKAIPATSFAEAKLFERADLQRLLREQIEILSPDTLVIAEEFADWEDSKRRIDLLGIDRDAKLVVIELKRTEDGGHMELQALRYAAMVSTMTLERASAVYARHRGMESEDARAALLEFLGWDEADEERFAQDVRIVLASAEFSKELTTAVLWLNERDLDIRCVRLQPYRDGARILLDVAQVLPLPEAQEYQVRLREKETRERHASPPWTEEEFRDALARSGADVAMAERVIEWARAHGLLLSWSRGRHRGGVQAVLSFGAGATRYIPFRLRSDGVLVVRCDWIERKPALADGRLLAEFKAGLAAVPGLENSSTSGARPLIDLASLADPAAWKAMTDALSALASGIRQWHEERGVAMDTLGEE